MMVVTDAFVMAVCISFIILGVLILALLIKVIELNDRLSRVEDNINNHFDQLRELTIKQKIQRQETKESDIKLLDKILVLSMDIEKLSKKVDECCSGKNSEKVNKYV